jgi:hypothetical protein
VYRELKAQLEQQLSFEGLQRALNLAREGCRASERPVGLFVLARVLEAIESYWRDRGSISADAEIMLSEVASPMRRYLDARARARLDGNRETAYLDEIVKAFLRSAVSHERASS